MDSSHKTQFDTACIHAGQHPDELFGGVSVPIYQSSTFAFANAEQGAARFSGQSDGYKYTRLGNPTTAALEACIAELEGGGVSMATASGMAAVSTAYMALLGHGAHAVSTDSVYGPSRTLLEKEFTRYGIQVDFVDTSNLEQLKKVLRPNTRLLYLETPANPTLSITDIASASRLAHEVGAVVVVDNTFCSPMLQRPLDLGADIVLHSMTKFLNGHSDVVAGILVTRSPELAARLKTVLVQMGGTIDPHQAWLVLRGVKTLALRIRAAQENAIRLATDLQQHPLVSSVRYPGLKDHPQHELSKMQMKGPGSMISFELNGGVEAGRLLMNTVKLSTLAVSLGGIETLIQHPASMTHASVSRESRIAAGISDGLVRLSVGCEAYEDLRADLLSALDSVRQQLTGADLHAKLNVNV
ncbi:MAG TPA: PLP-dependent aspartate aminotransferase family protein [Candidatus Ozemobacteraceae bacterium]|nr:PLP-dependent aspartate aminotransferase family protein [Candidatus Ozemobacteraceae bacterium]